MFTRSEVIVLTNKHTYPQTNKRTNKQTPLKTSNALRYATMLGRPNQEGYFDAVVDGRMTRLTHGV